MKEQRKIDFYKQLNVSPRTQYNYRSAITSTFVKGVLNDYCGTNDLFEINDLDKLWIIYTHINLHPTNIATHRAYSAALMKYIKFLNNGKKYGKRIDWGKKKGHRKSQA